MRLMRPAAAGLCLSIAFIVAGCSAEPVAGERPSATRQKIVSGTPHAGDPGVVMLSKGGAQPSICTGSLVGQRVVITARHCIEASQTDPTVASPSMVQVGTGLNGQEGLTPVRQMFTTPGRAQDGSGDFAVLVLERALGGGGYGFVTSTPQDRSGASMTAIGFGTTDVRNQDAGTKRRSTARLTNIYSGTFATSTVGCYGDSGGPVFLPDGRVWGVLATFENVGGLHNGNYADCAISDSVWARTDAHLDLIRQGFAAAGESFPANGDQDAQTGGRTGPGTGAGGAADSNGNAGSGASPESGCGAARNEGVDCSGSTLTWCNELGQLRSFNCNDDGRTCRSDYCAPGPWCCRGGAEAGAGQSDLCNDACNWPADGECDDGGPGAVTRACAFGTDCSDCGSRAGQGGGGAPWTDAYGGDADRDGVHGQLDRCPQTPSGAPVWPYGEWIGCAGGETPAW